MTETTEPKEPPDELVWRICPYIDGSPDECRRCPEWQEVDGHGRASPGCYTLARSVINIAQTGNPWRRPS